MDNATDGGNGLPVIVNAATAGTLTINGNGATIARSSAGGTPSFRILDIASGGNLTLNNTVISNGNTSGSGGGILNKGTLSVNDSSLELNGASVAGGAISNNGTVTVNESSLINNAATVGGGIANNSGTTNINSSTLFLNHAGETGGAIAVVGGSVTVSNCTFENNTAGVVTGSPGSVLNGAGIYNAATLIVSNTTMTGNSAANLGGAIGNSSAGVLTISHSTLSINSAIYGGGGIYSQSSSFDLGSTIVAGNTANTGSPDIAGTVHSDAYNVIGNTTGTTITGDTSGNLVNGAASPLNLDQLHDNGGTTETMALLYGSVAINAGDPAFVSPPDYDQRGAGFPRLVNGRIDIGAYEFGSFETAPPDTNLIVNGDFGDGTNDWTFYGPVDYWAPGGMLQFKHTDNSAPGGFYPVDRLRPARRRAVRGHGRTGRHRRLRQGRAACA